MTTATKERISRIREEGRCVLQEPVGRTLTYLDVGRRIWEEIARLISNGFDCGSVNELKTTLLFASRLGTDYQEYDDTTDDLEQDCALCHVCMTCRDCPLHNGMEDDNGCSDDGALYRVVTEENDYTPNGYMYDNARRAEACARIARAHLKMAEAVAEGKYEYVAAI